MNHTNLIKLEDVEFQNDIYANKPLFPQKYNLDWLQVSPNIFYVWDTIEDTKIVYSPLHGQLFDVNNEGDSIINDYLAQDRPTHHPFHKILAERGFLDNVNLPEKDEVSKPFNPINLTLSLTSACNLRCIYCYADAGFNTDNLDWDTIKTSVDTLVSYARSIGENYIAVAFHGGGEPTVLWKRLVATVEYVLNVIPADWEVGFSLVTNGTLISKDKAQWLASHKFKITVSIDGLEEVQNLQRPKANGTGSYNDLIKGIDELVKADVDFALRSTITESNQHQLIDFVELVHKLGCKDVSVVPVSSVGRGFDAINPVDPNIFIHNFILAEKKAKTLGMDFSTISVYVDTISARYCGADGNIFAVMPDGTISSCTRMTRQTDALADIFTIGHWDADGIFIDNKKVQSLRNLHLYTYSQCNNCFARFTCSGGCHHERLSTNTSIMPQAYCTIAQSIVWHQLLGLLESEMG